MYKVAFVDWHGLGLLDTLDLLEELYVLDELDLASELNFIR